MYLFFFFQAEDGIRDYKVTGVQTCALPIYFRYRPCSHSLRHPARGSNSRFSDQSPCVRGSSKSRAMAQCADRTADCGNIRRYEISRNQELMGLNFQFPLRGITPASGLNCSSTTKKRT